MKLCESNSAWHREGVRNTEAQNTQAVGVNFHEFFSTVGVFVEEYGVGIRTKEILKDFISLNS